MEEKYFNISQLRAIQNEIMLYTGSADVISKYLHVLRTWLKRDITFNDFDRATQHLLPVDLHSKFLVAVMDMLDAQNVGEGTNLCTSQLFEKKALTSVPNESLINTMLLLFAFEFGLDEVNRECAFIVSKHLKAHIANLLETTLRLSNPFLITEAGFTHSFGIQKLNNSNPKCAFRPIKSYKISVEDLIDCLNLDEGLISRRDMRALMFKQLENVVTAPNSTALLLSSKESNKTIIGNGVSTSSSQLTDKRSLSIDSDGANIQQRFE